MGEKAGYVGDLAVVGLEGEVQSDSPGNGKRKRGQEGGGGGGGGVTKGASGFMKRVESAGVKVIRAPKGMSRNKSNGSRWLAKYVPCFSSLLGIGGRGGHWLTCAGTSV